MQRFIRRNWLLAGPRLLALAILALALMPAAASGGQATWGTGLEAVLPADAATSNQDVLINSISCSSVGYCGAVGNYRASSGGTQGLLLTEKAGTWANAVEAALPADAAAAKNQYVDLNSVSCPSNGNCTAVGSYSDSSGNSEGLLLTEADGVWETGGEVAPPANAASTGQWIDLHSVSCASAGECTVVGDYQVAGSQTNHSEALLLTETAGNWATAIEAPLPGDADTSMPSAFMTSVSCTSPGACTAVGGYRSTGGSGGLLLTQAAGNWTTGIEAALPADAAMNSNAGIRSVSCTSAGNCTAAGIYQSTRIPGGDLLLTQTNGSWATGVEPALPADANPALNALYDLPAVSCASAGNCTAVGTYIDAYGHGEGLLLTETNGTWADGIETTLPLNAVPWWAELVSVSCPSAGNCTAVGSYDTSPNAGEGLLVTEGAGSWASGAEAVLPSNAYPGNPGAGLSTVSCTAPGDCSAAGSFNETSTGRQGVLLGSPPPLVELDVATNGSGSGTASSLPTGIDCGSACSAFFGPGTSVTLTATPAAGSRFAGWSGNCAGSGTCTVTMTAARSVTATFVRQYQLSVTRTGSGSGAIASLPAGVMCGASCSAFFDPGTSVTLTATPAAGSRFAGWSGDCAGSGSCTVSMAAARSVTATFVQTHQLSVARSGTGSGGVTSSPAGIACKTSCSASFDAGTSVTLSATAAAGSQFSGWSGGGCSGTSVTCHADMSSDQTVTATFTLVPRPCTVPRLKGESLKAAKRTIRTHACSVGKIKRTRSTTIKQGRVVSQKPKPGSRLKHGATVSLMVSRGNP